MSLRVISLRLQPDAADPSTTLLTPRQHILGDLPPFCSMRFYAVGTPDTIAIGLNNALSHVNVKA